MLVRRLLFSFALCAALGLAPAQAQPDRAPVPRLQAAFAVGATTPMGDAASSLGLGPARVALTGGLSARLAPVLALDLTQDAAFGDDGVTETSTRYTTRLAARLLWPQRTAAPYLLAGLSGTAVDEFVVGGAVGLGLDWAVSRQFDLFQQITFDIPFSEAPPGSPINAFGFLSAGVRVRIAPLSRPVETLTLSVPDTVLVREEAAFTASANTDAARPVTFTWTFDDGQTSTGETVTRSFRYPRPYTATVTAENRDGRVSETRQIVVAPPEIGEDSAFVANPAAVKRPATILELYGRRTLEVGEVENFRVRLAPGATSPVNYTWDFGDGVVAVGNNVAHWYREPGTYTVRVTARNVAGGDSAQALVTVTPPPPSSSEPSDALPPAGFGWVAATLPSRRDAETLAASYRSAGHDARVLIHDADDRDTPYRVVVGQYPTETAAERDRRAVETLAAGPVWLLPFHGDPAP